MVQGLNNSVVGLVVGCVLFVLFVVVVGELELDS